MTDYSSGKSSSWKKQQTKNKWQRAIAVLILVGLSFAILNGIVKSISFSKALSKSKWGGKGTFSAVFGTDPAAIFVFQQDPKRIAVFTIDRGLSYFTGKVQEPIKKIDESYLSKNGQEISKTISLLTGANISNFVVFNDDQNIDPGKSREMFESFVSIGTPIKILTTGWGKDVKDTNITRIDALKLWWQLKGIGIDKLEFTDLSGNSQEIADGKNKKVLGADTASLNRQIFDYFEDLQITGEGYEVEIENATGIAAAGSLASRFVSSTGAMVVSVNIVGVSQPHTTIFSTSNDDSTPMHLAKIFDCDIKDKPKTGDEREITVILGSDFADRFFE